MTYSPGRKKKLREIFQETRPGPTKFPAAAFLNKLAGLSGGAVLWASLPGYLKQPPPFWGSDQVQFETPRRKGPSWQPKLAGAVNERQRGKRAGALGLKEVGGEAKQHIWRRSARPAFGSGLPPGSAPAWNLRRALRRKRK